MIPAFKKIGELLADYMGSVTGIEVLSYRIGGIWGPLGRTASPFFAAPQLVHAAVRGMAADLSALHSPPCADDVTDLCYVKDCGRAIALLQLSEQLSHRTYNVAAGRATTYRRSLPRSGRSSLTHRSSSPAAAIRTGRAMTHTSTSPGSTRTPGTSLAYDAERAVADYIGWLRARKLSARENRPRPAGGPNRQLPPCLGCTPSPDVGPSCRPGNSGRFQSGERPRTATTRSSGEPSCQATAGENAAPGERRASPSGTACAT